MVCNYKKFDYVYNTSYWGEWSFFYWMKCHILPADGNHGSKTKGVLKRVPSSVKSLKGQMQSKHWTDNYQPTANWFCNLWYQMCHFMKLYSM